MLGLLTQTRPLVFTSIELLGIRLARLSAQRDESNLHFLAIAT
jgi:hypothetical protein